MNQPPTSEQAKQQARQQARQQATAQPDDNNRSPGLLPGGEDDPNLQVAEEVAFDLQSDAARKVGAMPDEAAQAMASAVEPEGKPGKPLPGQGQQ